MPREKTFLGSDEHRQMAEIVADHHVELRQCVIHDIPPRFSCAAGAALVAGRQRHIVERLAAQLGICAGRSLKASSATNRTEFGGTTDNSVGDEPSQRAMRLSPGRMLPATGEES
jgi:hypothetical protein